MGFDQEEPLAGPPSGAKKVAKKNVETISIYLVASTLGRILQLAAAY